MNYELSLGVPAVAVGLSAISFSAALQKDAAPIPNAGRLLQNKVPPLKICAICEICGSSFSPRQAFRTIVLHTCLCILSSLWDSLTHCLIVSLTFFTIFVK